MRGNNCCCLSTDELFHRPHSSAPWEPFQFHFILPVSAGYEQGIMTLGTKLVIPLGLTLSSFPSPNPPSSALLPNCLGAINCGPFGAPWFPLVPLEGPLLRPMAQNHLSFVPKGMSTSALRLHLQPHLQVGPVRRRDTPQLPAWCCSSC